MIRILGDALAIASTGAFINSIVRLVLALLSSRFAFSSPDQRRTSLDVVPGSHSNVSRWLIVIPSRSEGELIEPTLGSIHRAANGFDVRVLVLLDGLDPRAEQAAENRGFGSVTKEPAGPTKAAALRWLARERRSELLACDAVLVLDVGSNLSDGFFDSFAWPRGADAVQCYLSGRGSGAGKAAAASENFAQHREDVGRELLGWSVQLRGTGTAYRPAVFIEAVEMLVTQTEDIETSLLLRAAGRKLQMGPPAAVVFDEKPHEVRQAARQRSRWLAGQIELPIRHWRAFGRLIGRRPGEGIAFLSEIFARPLVLTVLLRVLGGALLMATGGGVRTGLAFVLILSAVSDVLWIRTARYFSWRESMTLLRAWINALAGVPRAFEQWRRTRKP